MVFGVVFMASRRALELGPRTLIPVIWSRLINSSFNQTGSFWTVIWVGTGTNRWELSMEHQLYITDYAFQHLIFFVLLSRHRLHILQHIYPVKQRSLESKDKLLPRISLIVRWRVLCFFGVSNLCLLLQLLPGLDWSCLCQAESTFKVLSTALWPSETIESIDASTSHIGRMILGALHIPRYPPVSYRISMLSCY